MKKHIIPLMSLFVALIAIFEAQYAMKTSTEANEVAQEANQIAKDTLKEQFIISYRYPFVDNTDLYKEPCKSPNGDGYWLVYYAPMFDVTNTGSKAITLFDLDYEDGVNTNDERIVTSVYYNFFRSLSDFKAWFALRDFSPLSENIRQSLKNYDAVGSRIKIEAGETKRLFLWGQIQVYIDSELTLDQVFQLSKNSYWEEKIIFMFDNGMTKDVSVYVPGPYDGGPGRTGEYQFCPNP